MNRLARSLSVLVVATAVTALTGCLGWFLPPSPGLTSTPTGEDVAPELESFYSQELVWERCGNGMQCTTARAPLDWSDPAAAEITLALVRKPAWGRDPLGSLLVNPGGPGASGVDFILNSSDFATSRALQEKYDIVGFDPRGVGASSAVSCYDDPAVMDEYVYGIAPGEPGTDEWIAAVEAATAEFAAGCLEHTGPLLEFVDTISAARDMDLLRAVLGDEKLNFLGYSYGTLLGATYAELYPAKTGRLVLDGAVDPRATDFDVTATQAQGFESAFRAYLDDCLGRSGCPFRGSVDDALAATAEILADLEAEPLAGRDGRLLGTSTMFIAIILPLYNEENWPYLDDLFSEVPRGQTGTAFLLADSYYERNPDGTYSTNSTEAFIAINCLDYIVQPTSIETMREQAAELAELAPLFGPAMSYGGSGCDSWPFPGKREPGEIRAEGSGDILVIGTTNDPATPYVWAERLADQLDNGHLVTYQGEGHTAYNKSNRCVNDAVDGYFLDGTVPSSDPMC